MSRLSQFPAHPSRARHVCGESLAETIEITVNGERRAVVRGATVADLLADLGVAGKRVAVERNLDIVPRATYDNVVLTAGDTLEVVGFVGGG